eukprot:1157079-Pelagomonas_calceolata.AAC.1
MKTELVGAHKRMQPRASAPDGIRFPAANKKLGVEMSRSGGLGLKSGAGVGLGTVMAGRNSSKADEGGGGSVRSGGHGLGSREGRNSYTGSGGLMKDTGDRNSGGGRTVGIGTFGGGSGDRNSGGGRTVAGYGSGSSSNSNSSSSSSSTSARVGGPSAGRVGAGAGSSGRGASTAVQLPAVTRTGVASRVSSTAGQGSVMASRGRGSSSTSTPTGKPTSLPANSRNRGRSWKAESTGQHGSFETYSANEACKFLQHRLPQRIRTAQMSIKSKLVARPKMLSTRGSFPSRSHGFILRGVRQGQLSGNAKAGNQTWPNIAQLTNLYWKEEKTKSCLLRSGMNDVLLHVHWDSKPSWHVWHPDEGEPSWKGKKSLLARA